MPISMTTVYDQFSAVLMPHCRANSRLVVGFSGGVDSRVLLDLAVRYSQERQIPCIAVHVHHGLSANADRWAQQCAQWCAQSGVDLIVEKVVLDRQGGESLEQVARTARYQVLRQHIRANDLLLIGQHADDQVETFLLALKRGSGPKGLSSMAMVSELGFGTLVRPLLPMSRCEIEQYAVAQDLEWLEDESNQDTRFDRNFIRHHITPRLVERWPSFQAAVQRSAQLCAQQEALLDELLSDKYAQIVNQNMSLDISALRMCSEPMRQRLLRMWFAHSQQSMPSQAHLERIWCEVASAQHDANPCLKVGSVNVRRFAKRLYLLAPMADVSHWRSPIGWGECLHLPDNLGQLRLQRNMTGSSLRFGLDLSQCDPQQLWISFEPQGLTAHPVGRAHRRQLKKLFQEYQVPSWLRRRTPILMYGEQVVCVADLFVDCAFSGQNVELCWQRH